jgi:molybdopterin converting factor small subunit
VFVGAENVRSLGGAATVLQPGDEVSILAAISGG